MSALLGGYKHPLHTLKRNLTFKRSLLCLLVSELKRFELHFFTFSSLFLFRSLEWRCLQMELLRVLFGFGINKCTWKIMEVRMDQLQRHWFFFLSILVFILVVLLPESVVSDHDLGRIESHAYGKAKLGFAAVTLAGKLMSSLGFFFSTTCFS